MRRVRTLSFAGRVIAAFTAVFLCMLALGLVGLGQTSAINARAVDVRDKWLKSTQALGLMAVELEDVRTREAHVVIAALHHDADAVRRAVADWRAVIGRVEQATPDIRRWSPKAPRMRR